MSTLRRRLTGLPIRLRLTLAFAAAMAITLGALGIFILLVFRNDLRATLDEGLRARLQDVAAAPRAPDALAQVYDARGTVVDGATVRLLSPAEARRAARGTTVTVGRRDT